jgi:uncharacterized protein YqgC (DUF456 family)
MAIFWAIVLVVFAIGLWALNVIGLPGNWLVLAAAVLYAVLTPSDQSLGIEWPTLAALLVLALFGELLEFLASALGASQAGGSRRSAALALGGSLVGGVLGLFVGFPIPVIGPVVAALLLGGAGALVGAALGERWKGRNWDDSVRVGQAAFWGRLLGTLGKAFVGTLMMILILVALFV